MNNTKKKLTNIDSSCRQFLTDFSALEEPYRNSIKNLSEEQKSCVLQILEQLKVKESKFLQQIKENISTIVTYNEDQKCSLDSMREQIIERFATNNTQLEKQTEKINITLDCIKQKSLENLQELQKITSQLNEDRSFLEEEQKLIEEFQRNMKTLQQKRSKRTDNISCNVKYLENSQHEFITLSESSSVDNKEFLSKRTDENKDNCSLVELNTTKAEFYVDQSVGKCSTINVQLDNLLQESHQQAQEISNTLTKYDKDLTDTSQRYENDCKRLRVENCANIKVNIEEIHQTLDDHEKSLKNHLHILKDSNYLLQNSIRDYTHLYKRQMTQCVNDLESFRRSELKTYTATGATPSKKEFSYPKILVETSPHSCIVKRFRQENNWSDLDTTAPIDEVGSD